MIGVVNEQSAGLGTGVHGDNAIMSFILWLIAVVLVVWGIVTAVRGQLLLGIVLVVLGLLVGPGGVSIFS
ncbi:MAG: hypothetical protein V7637_4403 [Mycobacteriales bacterium]